MANKMVNAYFCEDSIDDLMRVVLEEIKNHGTLINSTKGRNTEISGVLLELTNPRARLSMTETKGKLFSCLGEFCWYLAKSDQLDFIKYYLSSYENSAEEGKLQGAYGPRLFNVNGLNQLCNVIKLLKSKPHSRQAVIQIFSGIDISVPQKDVPCTCTLQFLIRDSALHLLVNMRSNDVTRGFTHDVFCFTMLQEIVAKTLEVGLGNYKQVVGSLHLYCDQHEKANQFLDEGWQPTCSYMPEMPDGNPWQSIEFLLKIETQIRLNKLSTKLMLNGLDPYWADLVRLLQVFKFFQDSDYKKIEAIKADLVNEYYHPFIERKLISKRN